MHLPAPKMTQFCTAGDQCFTPAVSQVIVLLAWYAFSFFMMVEMPFCTSQGLGCELVSWPLMDCRTSPS